MTLATYQTSNLINYLKRPTVLKALEAEKQRRDFKTWLPAVTPDYVWDWRHLRFIQSQLDRVTNGEIDRLMIFLPPRHGKSEMVTVRYPVWRMERDPKIRVIIGAYNQTLAEMFSRRSRAIANERIKLSVARNVAEDWETDAGGGYRAVGVGGGITGRGGNLIIIDDPVKNRAEANSAAYRESVWNWYKDDLYTRREPGAAIILIMTRWHNDDLAGRILESENKDDWTVVNLPALAEENDLLGREPGAALCPDRFNEEEIADIHKVLGNSFYALYQQRPTAQEGGMFKRQWFTSIISRPPATATRIRYWDKAGSDAAGDYTAGVKISLDLNGFYTVEDVIHGQWSIFDRERIIRQTAELDGVDTQIWIEQEPGSGGKDSALSTIRNLAGFTVHADRPTGDKSTRAEPFAAQCEAGNVRLVQGEWIAAYLTELTGFPFGKNDDMVDASSGAFNKLSRPAAQVITYRR